MGALGNLAPLLILFILLAGAAFIGYQVYLWSQQMGDRGRDYMERKHVSYSKDGGLKVGVKELKDEAYADKTQNLLVNVWNNASFPNYKSSLGWNTGAEGSSGGDKRPVAASAASAAAPQPPSHQSHGSSSAAAAGQAQPKPRPAKSGSVPGGFD